MARRAYTQELYEAIVKGFREAPGNATFAAKVAGCDRRMALRAWKFGWNHLPWAKPIYDVISLEREEARKEVRREEARKRDLLAQEQERLRQDAIEAVKEEGNGIRLARRAALNLAAACLHMNKAVVKIAEVAAKEIESNPEVFKSDPMKAAKFTELGARAFARATQAIQGVVEMTRLVEDKPTKIIGVQSDAMTVDEAVAELESAGEIIQRARELGMVAIKGGKSDDLPVDAIDDGTPDENASNEPEEEAAS